MGAIAIDRDPGLGILRPKYLAIAGLVVVGIVLAVKTDLGSVVAGLDGDGVDGNPNDPDECLTARTMLQEIDSDIHNYTVQLAAATDPFTEAYLHVQIARAEVEKKYIEYVYGCTSSYGNH